jgi:hypothetical protein
MGSVDDYRIDNTHINADILTFSAGVGRNATEADDALKEAKGDKDIARFPLAFYQGDPLKNSIAQQDDLEELARYRRGVNLFPKMASLLHELSPSERGKLHQDGHLSAQDIARLIDDNDSIVRNDKTGLYTLVGLLDLFGEDNWSGTWLFMDANRTKKINDTKGHPYVDKLLYAASLGFALSSRVQLEAGEFSVERRRAEVKGDDILCRLYRKGDEFLARLKENYFSGEIDSDGVKSFFERVASNAEVSQLYGIGIEVTGFDSLYEKLDRKGFKKGSIL